MRYTLLRLLLLMAVFLTVWLVLYALNVHSAALVIALTLVISVPLSYVVLKGPRTAMTQQLADRMAARTGSVGEELDADADAEDAEAEALRARSAERERQGDE